MKRTKYYLTLVFIWTSIISIAQAQDVRIDLGPDEIGLNETFSIKITISDEKIKSYDQFPEIPGFQKQGISQSSSMNVINGQMSSTNSIVQYYKPLKKGQFSLPNFTLQVNGNEVSSPGKTITVTEAKQSQQRPGSRDPFDDFFRRDEPQEQEFIELDDEAFFAMTVDKNEIYVGEGFNVSLAFFMAQSNQAPFDFYEPGKQLEEIVKKIKPTNAWEENFNITNIQPERVTIDGKVWTRFKVYESTFYPFNEGEIELPRVAWEMIKYKVAKNPTFFGNNRQQDFKTFYANGKTIKVKPLPPHPLKNEVSVGVYRLRENFDSKKVETGEGVTYDFGISGEGNINAIKPPKKMDIQKLNTFDPNERQQINRGRGKVSGIKQYEYYITVNEPGEVALKDHFEWIYFNTDKETYDTLRPSAVLNVVGESKINQSISSTSLGGIYDLIELEDNKLLNQRYKYYFSTFINILLVGAVILLIVMIMKKR
ncbi:BatD family protein [Echinicola sp. CAU 1574]|uniref:BatD family protein n=1 Tax=Echinicola arenosa TaxID=2774144 RepID=A0ABR9ALE0_9BACT|nr:BatD family protein [Echinicola arenosa]MBD8489616.1 BatD family protein [Echinicola arenosa]